MTPLTRARALLSGCWIAAVLGVAFSSFLASAAEKELTIKEARADRNGDNLPDLQGQRVVLAGKVILTPIPFGAGTLSYLQDATGGIALYSSAIDNMRGKLSEGATIKVEGKITHYAGADVLDLQRVLSNEPGAPLAPRDVLAADLMGKEHYGELVRVSGKLASGATNAAGLISLRDRSGAIPIYIPDVLFADATFLQDASRHAEVEITGISSVYAKPPYTSGFLLMPRSKADFRFTPMPPYREIAVASCVAGLLAFALYLNARQKRAQARTLEMGRLLQEKQASETALIKAKQDFTALVNSIEGIVWEADAATLQFMFVSSEAERLLGYPVADWLAPGFWSSHLHEEDRDRVLETTQAALEAKTSHELEYRMWSRKKEVVWLRDIVTVVVEGGHSTRLRGLMLDITSTKKLEAQLLQSQKMQSLGQLAGGVAHDFNNILTVIQGHATLLRSATGLTGDARASLQEITASADRAAHLTKQLLLFSRQQVARLKPINLNEAVQGVVRMLERLLGETVRVRFHPAPDLPLIKADAVMVEQVIINLAINARDAMPNGGALIMETFWTTCGEEVLAKNPEAIPGRFAGLRLQDNGVGMDTSVLPHIFEPFFTTKDIGKGTGLGLSTVYGIVKQHKGWIQVESQPGIGTKFEILLPCMADGRPFTAVEWSVEPAMEQLRGPLGEIHAAPFASRS